jgi:hypothetical protein
MKGRLDRATLRLSQNPQEKQRTSILHTMKEKERDVTLSKWAHLVGYLVRCVPLHKGHQFVPH